MKTTKNETLFGLDSCLTLIREFISPPIPDKAADLGEDLDFSIGDEYKKGRIVCCENTVDSKNTM